MKRAAVILTLLLLAALFGTRPAPASAQVVQSNFPSNAMPDAWLAVPPITSITDPLGILSFGTPTAGSGVVSATWNSGAHITRGMFALLAPQTITATTTALQTFGFAPSGGNTIAANSLNPGDTMTFFEIGEYTTPLVSLSLVGTVTPAFVVNGAQVLTGNSPVQLPVNISGTLGFRGYVIGTVVTTGTSGTIRMSGYLDIQTTLGSAPITVTLPTTMVTVNTTAAITAIPGVVFSLVQTGESIEVDQIICRLN